ncbi:MAG: stage V sporulation protein AC [Oscillospiraceae bacterium]|nr:stage V sporulation protein AC [Oscillospiraceae bacterium]
MDMTPQEYQDYVKRLSPKSPIWKDCINAFWIGGLICVVGQLLLNWYLSMGMGMLNAGSATTGTMVFLGATFTALHLYDNLANIAGAGTLVPVTGFANSIVSPAIEFKSEGWVMGVGARMFAIAGPVLVYGIGASVVYGVLYWCFTAL